MNTKERAQEQISAFADGELDDPYIDSMLTALREQDLKRDWELYQLIGDALRSDDMAISMSPDFAPRMAARLEAEPTIIATTIATESQPLSNGFKSADFKSSKSNSRHSVGRRWGLPGVAAAAAVAAIGFVFTPQLMVAMKGDTGGTSSDKVRMASTDAATIATNGADGVVLRDPQIDDYLIAHQYFSPSVYSTAQYARTAAFAVDSNK